MALIDQVKAACKRLAPFGWRDLLLAHGLDITAANLAQELGRTLPNIKRSVKGFEDFALEGRKGITPGQPARSLLYHAFASSNVVMRPDGSRLTAFPTLAEIEAVENYVFSVDAPSLQQLKNRAGTGRLAVVVFAYEYRAASQTCHKKHADLVFSRTGVARVGTAPALYDAARRGFVPTDDKEQFAVRVSPARYAAYIAVATKGDSANFCPLRFRVKGATPNDAQKSDADRNFWQPLHKLFSGSECLRGLHGKLDVSLISSHLNEKLRRIHLTLRKQHGSPGVPFDTGWTEPDISQSPFTFTRGIAEFSTKADYGKGVLIPIAHQKLVELATYKGKPLFFNVPPNVGTLSSSIEIPWDNGALHAPEYVHARHRLRDNGSIENLNDSSNVEARVGAGGYKALHYLDFTGDGAIEARCPKLVSQPAITGGFIPAYSLVTAPDFFPACDQRELTEWTDTLPPDLRQDIWRITPDTLSDQRFAGNLQLPNSPFKPADNTVTAIISMFGKIEAQQTLTKQADTLHHSHMPDNSAGVFAPGWDVSRDRLPDGTWHLSAYGLGSPFPEDAKLCAALSTFWPSAAPDSTRTFTYGAEVGWETVSPLTDEEIGQIGTLSWDGAAGPKVVTSDGQEFAEYASFGHVDYIENALQNKFSLRVTAHIDLLEYQRRVLGMALAYKVLGNEKTDWVVLSFQRVNPGTPELVNAQAAGGLSLPGRVYRFEVFKNPKTTTIPGGQFRKRRMAITSRTLLFVDADNRRVLSKASAASAATWKGKEFANI